MYSKCKQCQDNHLSDILTLFMYPYLRWIYEVSNFAYPALSTLIGCVACMSQSHCANILPLHGVHSATAWGPFCHCMGSILPLHGVHSATAWGPFCHCMGSILPLHGVHSATAWGQFCHCMGSILPLHGVHSAEVSLQNYLLCVIGSFLD